jgi:aminoglycoside 3-N-acetyltransferase I
MHADSIHLLTSADVTMMRGMLALFAEAFDERSTYLARQPDDTYLRQLLASDTFVAIAALAGDEVIGGIAGYVLHKFEQARSECYVYDLAVSEAHRRQGVASAMLRRLQDVAAERGIYVIFVQADYVDEPAVALYTKFGQREDVLHFDIPPGGADV